MKAVCHMNLGQYTQAVSFFSKLLLADTDNVCFYQRELALYMASRLDDDVLTYKPPPQHKHCFSVVNMITISVTTTTWTLTST